MTQRHLVGAVLFSLCVAGPARAQVVATFGGGGGAAASYFLLFNPAVQKELKLTDEQNKKIQAKIQESMPQGGTFQIGGEVKGGTAKAGDGKGGDAKGGEGPKISFQIGGGNGAKAGAAPPIVIGGDGSNFRMPDFKKIDQEVNKLLDEKQRDRLKQLGLQTQGMMAVGQAKVADELGLQEEQRDIIKHILQEHGQKTKDLLTQLREEGNLDPQSFGERMRKQREATEKDLGLILTDEQKEKWSKMTGPKFDFGLGFGGRR